MSELDKELGRHVSQPAGVGDAQTRNLAEEVRMLTAALRTEKSRRVYYQSIVYDVCRELDKMRVNNVEGLYRVPGGAIICGTIKEPSHAVQDEMTKLVETVQRLTGENKRLQALASETLQALASEVRKSEFFSVTVTAPD